MPRPETRGARDGRPALRAFRALAVKEARGWTRSHAWWSQPAIFAALALGAVAVPTVLLRDVFASEPGGPAAAASGLAIGTIGLASAIAAVLWFQDALVGERRSGTAAWILSKPVPRWALPVSKAVVSGGLLIVAAVALPATLAYLVLRAASDTPPSAVGFVAAAGILALHTAFYVAATLAVGAVTDARAAVVAVPLAVLLLGDMVVGVVPAAAHVAPWLLARGAGLVAQGMPFPVPWALASTAAWTAVLVVLAVVRFGRQDL